MEHVMTVVLVVGAGIVVLQLVGFTEWFAKMVVRCATARLPGALRDRITEECHSEIKDVRGPFSRLYIALTCFLDAVRLEGMWRTELLRGLKWETENEKPNHSERTAMLYRPDWEDYSHKREKQKSDEAESSGRVRGQRAPVQDRRLNSFLAALKTQMNVLFAPSPYKPENRTNQQLLLRGCGGNVWRLEEGIWVKDG